MSSQQEKPAFQHIRQKAKTKDGQQITRQDIATLSGLSIGEAYVIDIGGYSSKQKIYKALEAFRKLTGRMLTIDDVKRGGGT